MIDGIKGAAALRELTALVQNLEKKLGLPLTLEVVQKIAQTPDGYKYLTQIDGKLLEILSKKELEVGARYWAEGTKNEAKNSLVLENVVQKPHLLQSELFRSELVSKALSLEKLIEILKADPKGLVSPQSSQKPQIAQKQPQSSVRAEKLQNKIAKNGEQTTIEPPLQKNLLRLEGAKLNLSSGEMVGGLIKRETPKDAAPSLHQKEEASQKEAVRAQRQSASPHTQATEQKLVAPADILLGDKKTVLPDAQKKDEEILKKEGTSQKDAVTKETVTKDAAVKEPSNEPLKKELLLKIKEGVRFSLESRGEPLKKADRLKKELSAELRGLKNMAAPPAPTKAELEKSKFDGLATQKEQKLPLWESLPDAKRVEIARVVSEILANSLQIIDKSLIASAAEKILEALFGGLPTLQGDEEILKAIEEVLKKMEAKEERGDSKKAGGKLPQKVEEADGGINIDSAKIGERAEQKSENPASKLKAALLEELSKVTTKSEFQVLSQVAIALNREVFTFVFKNRGVVQFRKGGKDGELNAKRIEFYSAFETLGPICGEIFYGGATTVLNIYAEFESIYKILKENIKELSYFDQKNVAIKHGIKEISEIRSSFLDTTG